MESYGAHCVYVIDSGGALTMNDVPRALPAPSTTCSKPETETGMHAHHNLSLGVANSHRRRRERRDRIDASLAGMGAGAGNAPLEVFIAAADGMGWHHGCDLYRADGCRRGLVRPLQDRPVRVDRETLDPRLRRRVFQLPAPRRERGRDATASTPRDILVELGRRTMVGGQEDMIVDVALDLAKAG